MNDTYRTAKIKWVIREDRVIIKTELHVFSQYYKHCLCHVECMRSVYSLISFVKNLTWADDYFTGGRNCVFQSFELSYI
jgi:hypothetical protein